MDQLISEIAKPIVKKSWDEFWLAKGLDSSIKDLEERKTYIEAVLKDAHSSGLCSHAQQVAFDKLRDELERIEDFLVKRADRAEQTKASGADFLTEVRLLFSSSNPLVSRFKDAHKVKHIQRELELFNNNAQCRTVLNMVSQEKMPLEKMNQLSTGPYPNTEMIGRDVEKNDLIAKLCNSSNDQEPISTDAIVGIGGLGKTTLAQYVYNDPRVIDHFGLRLWVFATPNISLENLLEQIRAHAMNGKPPIHGMSALQEQIVEAIKDKKFLLVLDNIWDQDKLKGNWEQLRQLLKYGASGSKVVVTTRCKDVARIMGSLDPYMLKDLGVEKAWSLFQNFAFTSQPEPRVEAIGEEIFKMCPRIPLVLKVIAQHLSEHCHTIGHWRAFKDDLAKKSSFKGYDMIMGPLKLSYDWLDEKLKQFVDYCSLFPKGTQYDVDKMVRIWIALGYVKAEYKSLEEIAQDCVLLLAKRGFFDLVFFDEISNPESFTLHDIIHDVLVSKNESRYKMVDSQTTKINENICHVSFLLTGKTYEFDWDALSSVCDFEEQLKSILIVGDRYARYSDPPPLKFRPGCNELIARFRNLQVLDAHGMRIEKVPSSLSKLYQLRYLDLSSNKMIELPKSITLLVNLLLLDLSNCSYLQKLPKDINKLYKLRHLWLSYCSSLTYLPKGIGKLKDLQTLDVFIVGQHKGNVMGGLEELSDLQNLRGGLSIVVLVESKYIVSQGRIAPLGRKDNLIWLNLYFRNTKEDEMVLECLRPQGENLRKMTVQEYGGKKLPSWMSSDQLQFDLPNLYHIWMSCGSEISRFSLPEPEYRPCLKIDFKDDDQLLESIPGFSKLKGQLMTSFKEVGFKLPKGDRLSGLALWELSLGQQFATSQPLEQQPRFFFKAWFPNLKVLQLTSIPALQVLPEEFRDLSCLEVLAFCECYELKTLPDWIDTLISLKNIFVLCCAQFETLPHQISNLSQLVLLHFKKCSKALVERCRKPSGELWPYIQHVDYIYMSYDYSSESSDEKVTITYFNNEQ